jgi:hypothetical protein
MLLAASEGITALLPEALKVNAQYLPGTLRAASSGHAADRRGHASFSRHHEG